MAAATGFPGPPEPVVVPDLLARRASAEPSAAALSVAGAGTLTFLDWEQRSNAAGRGLIANGARPGDAVALLFDGARWLDFAVGCLAVHKAGAVAVPIASEPDGEDLRRLLRHSGAAVVISPADLAPGTAPAPVMELAQLEKGQDPTPLATHRRADAVADILFTPGPMRVPAAQPRTHGALLSTLPVWPTSDDALLHSFEPGTAAAQDVIVDVLRTRQGPAVALPDFEVGRFCALLEGGGFRRAGLPSPLARVLIEAAPPAANLACLTQLVIDGRVPADLRAALADRVPGAAVVILDRPEEQDGPEGVKDMAPLGPAHEGMVWHEHFSPGSFNLSPLLRRYHGPLDIGAMRAALGEIIRRHASLRSGYAIVDGGAVQLVWSPSTTEVPLVDLACLPEPDGVVELAAIVREARLRPFDLVTGRLFEPTIVRLGPEDHVLIIRAHHSVFDDWSIGPFRRELSALYAAFAAGEPSPLTEPTIQFADFCRQQRDLLEAGAGEAQRSFWSGELASAPLSVQLPIDDPGQPEGSPLPATAPLTVDLDPELTAQLQSLARLQRTTVFTVVLAAFGVLVQRYTGQDDLVVSSVVTHRNRRDLEGLIGCFGKKVLVHLELSGDPSFPELVARARGAVVRTLANQDLPHEEAVQSALGPAAAEHGLAPQIGVKFQTAVVPGDRLRLPGLTTSAVTLPAPAGQPHFLAGPRRASGDGEEPTWGAGLYLRTFLGLSLSEVEGRLRLVTEGVFHPPAVERLLDHFRVLLSSIAAQPDRPISQLALLGRAAHLQLESWNDTSSARPDDGDLHHAVAGQASRGRARTAVVGGGEALTYGQLQQRADRLSSLLRGSGAGPGTLVGVMLDAGTDVVVAVLAIWQAGAAYVGLDPADSDDHLRFVLDDAAVEVVIVAGEAQERLIGLHHGLTMVESPTTTATPPAIDGAERPWPSGSLACVFYGGGANALPHGVEIEHRSVANLRLVMRQCLQRPAFAAGFRLQVSAPALPTADGFLRQLVALADGHCLHLSARSGGDALKGIVSAVASGELHVVDCAPDDLGALCAAGLGEAIRARPSAAAAAVVVVGRRGRLDPDQREALAGLDGGEVVHLYGPPECAFAATAVATDRLLVRSVIGRPLANVRCHVLDQGQRPVPVGVVGQLCLAGDSLARGYHRLPGLTAERFVPDGPAPIPGGRLHDTGLLARFRPGGAIELLGTAASFVDLRGFRIEPARMEAALSGCPGVRRVSVVLIDGGPNGPSLVAFVVPEVGVEAPTLDQVRHFLWTRLPGYAWPAALVLVDDLPAQDGVTALPGHRAPRPAGGRTSQESMLASMWAETRGGDAAHEENYWLSFSFLDALSAAHRSGLAVEPRQVTRNRTLTTLAADIATTSARAEGEC